MSPLKPIYFTLDVGNTSCSVAVFRNNKLLKASPIRKNDLSGLKKFLSPWKEALHSGILSSVVKEDAVFLKFLHSASRVIRLHPGVALPIKNKYHTPETLGNDRLACVAGAHALFPRHPVLVIDAGTCIKYDFIDASGNYTGGSISPGLMMRFDALHHFTSALPLVQPGSIKKVTGQNTRESILTGVEQGIRFEMDGFIAAYKKQYKNLKVVMTGGDARRLAKPLKSDIFAAPHLIHLGLYEILKKNLA